LWREVLSILGREKNLRRKMGISDILARDTPKEKTKQNKTEKKRKKNDKISLL